MRYLVAGFQLVTWAAVVTILGTQGVGLLCQGAAGGGGPPRGTGVDHDANATTPNASAADGANHRPPPPKKTTAAVMVAIAALMLLLGPLLILARLLEIKRSLAKVPEAESPPSYEEACIPLNTNESPS